MKKKICIVFMICVCLLCGCGNGAIYTKAPQVLWTMEYNTGEEDKPTYIAEYGEWKRPWGLYSYTISEEYFFVEDSANSRILVYSKHGEPLSIQMDEEQVCLQMVYNEQENMLYMLQHNNVEVEPQGETYCRVALEEGSETQILQKDVSGVLDCDGKMIAVKTQGFRNLVYEVSSLAAEGLADKIFSAEEANILKVVRPQFIRMDETDS